MKCTNYHNTEVSQCSSTRQSEKTGREEKETQRSDERILRALTSPVASARAAVATGAWVISKLYLIT